MSTTQQGDEFRDRVTDLLRTQYFSVENEVIINGTKVDIYFEKEDFGSKIRFAVECKDYAKTLTKDDLERIYAKYNPMLQANNIDKVLIVSQKTLNAPAAAYIKGWRQSAHQTYPELAESLIGFSLYVQGLSKLLPTSDTPYIEARLKNQTTPALADIETWLLDEKSPAIAVLGGYGQGKTSFAKRIAAEFAKRHLQDPSNRIPILIRLGEVVHETQLEGLFGKEFTSRHRVRGYNFPALEYLNKQGRLLILLDGFDEMKHAMTAADFQANFQEFNRLLTSNSKVILLGRPNALPSDERELVFRGRAKVDDVHVVSAIFNRWKEISLDFFSKGETKTVLTSTLMTLSTKHGADGTYTYPSNFVEARVKEILDKVPSELLQRPVHVSLIAQVGSDPKFDLEGFNQFKLYRHFIHSMIERDTRDKPARRAIPIEPRKQFQRELAWWAWRRPGIAQGCFSRHEVPSTLLSDLPNGNSVDDEGKRNEYIVSTLTEEKEAGILFFAHRSFQEFLVAERLIETPTSPTLHTEYSKYLSPDISSFILDSPSLEFLQDWYATLRASPGPLDFEYLHFYSKISTLLPHVMGVVRGTGPEKVDPWSIFILGMATRQQTKSAPTWEDLTPLLLYVIRQGRWDSAAAATLTLLGQKWENQQLVLEQVASALISRCLQLSRAKDDDKPILTVDETKADFEIVWISEMLTKGFRSKQETQGIQLEFSPAHLADEILKRLEATGRLTRESAMANPYAGSTANYIQADAHRVYSFLNKDLRKAHSAFLNSKGDRFKVVTVKERRAKHFLSQPNSLGIRLQ